MCKCLCMHVHIYTLIYILCVRVHICTVICILRMSVHIYTLISIPCYPHTHRTEHYTCTCAHMYTQMCKRHTYLHTYLPAYMYRNKHVHHSIHTVRVTHIDLRTKAGEALARAVKGNSIYGSFVSFQHTPLGGSAHIKDDHQRVHCADSKALCRLMERRLSLCCSCMCLVSVYVHVCANICMCGLRGCLRQVP